ncbi:hypothetical protein VW23_023990 [Devosia insulae DS-56]|uniref:DUF5666 domain-containing protein n=1 Tax=Devosia insulae DS-56 TaxID=1116389 RepID=A0A1E5XML8_9HYPH|nr:DUF6152 family protein [Devosia insulae]OEO29847.1 hypothetical protein VW23_023990 [Devosia insulae DS-56]
MRRLRILLLAMALGAAMPVLPALAHHGWAWTEEELFELTGTVKSVFVGNPHATLDLEVEGVVWRVELAPPGPTVASGFTEETVKPGDEVVALGNRSLDPNEKRMKAVRVTVGGKAYDIYPTRVPAN